MVEIRELRTSGTRAPLIPLALSDTVILRARYSSTAKILNEIQIMYERARVSRGG